MIVWSQLQRDGRAVLAESIQEECHDDKHLDNVIYNLKKLDKLREYFVGQTGMFIEYYSRLSAIFDAS